MFFSTLSGELGRNDLLSHDLDGHPDRNFPLNALKH